MRITIAAIRVARVPPGAYIVSTGVGSRTVVWGTAVPIASIPTTTCIIPGALVRVTGVAARAAVTVCACVACASCASLRITVAMIIIIWSSLLLRLRFL